MVSSLSCVTPGKTGFLSFDQLSCPFPFFSNSKSSLSLIPDSYLADDDMVYYFITESKGWTCLYFLRAHFPLPSSFKPRAKAEKYTQGMK